MGQRRRSRELAVQVLYQLDMTGLSPEEALSLYFAHLADEEELEDAGENSTLEQLTVRPERFRAPLELRPFAVHLITGVRNHLIEIDQIIASASQHWRLDRMSIVDRNILRLAIYEMLFCGDIPPKVSINEAIDLGKKFSGEDSGPFINGVLDQVLLEISKKQALAQDDPT
jgi:transcription antitermination protein NusB